MTANPATKKQPHKSRTEFFYPITKSAKTALWPKHNAGLGLYVNLVGLVTVEIPDPDDKDKEIGIVLNGRQLTDAELASLVGCDCEKLRYEKSVLLKLGLLIQRRYRSSYRLAIRCSGKGCRKSALAPNYAWVGEAIDKSPKPPENRVERDSENQVEPDSCAVQPDSCAVEPDSLSGLDQQNHSDRSPDKRVDKKGEKRAEQDQKTALPISPESTPTPNLAEVCAKLYGIGKAHNPCQPTFSAKHRTEVGRLLATYSGEELCEAYTEFVKGRDDFAMRHAPKDFVEGGADDVIATIRERKHKIVTDDIILKVEMQLGDWDKVNKRRAQLGLPPLTEKATQKSAAIS